MMVETVDWLKPSPLWQEDGLDVGDSGFAHFRPRILEFQSDDFVEGFLAVVTSPRPDDIGDYVVTATTDGSTPKLYLPSHGYFYLVCASLCCRETHLPDRRVEPLAQGSVFAVLRKRSGSTEDGWVASGPTKGWRQVIEGGRALLAREEQMPLTPVVAGTGRTVWFGYLSLTSSEADDLGASRIDVARLGQSVADALPAPTRTPVEAPRSGRERDSDYVVRCVYRRPEHVDDPGVVSLATDPFRIASFLDSVAPVKEA